MFEIIGVSQFYFKVRILIKFKNVYKMLSLCTENDAKFYSFYPLKSAQNNVGSVQKIHDLFDNTYCRDCQT